MRGKEPTTRELRVIALLFPNPDTVIGSVLGRSAASVKAFRLRHLGLRRKPNGNPCPKIENLKPFKKAA
jgi:hypothetical protein